MSAARSPRPLRRRTFLGAVGATALVAGAGWGTNFLFAHNRRDRSNVGTLDFSNPLKIPRGGGQVHAFHIHGATFNVLEVLGEEPPAFMRGPKDTAYLPGTGTIRLAVRFDTLTDDNRPYMYHCHILRHEDSGMMGQFLVVEPGREDKVSKALQDGGGPHH
jgi:hypothetical protein